MDSRSTSDAFLVTSQAYFGAPRSTREAGVVLRQPNPTSTERSYHNGPLHKSQP
jgi:hypothetical protein